MKILFCIRSDYLTNFAGDSKQLLKTADYLRQKGLSITINSGEITDYGDYDIVHLFNLTRITETYRYFKAAQKFRKPIVITPIYWNLSKYYRFASDEQNLSLWNYYRTYRKEIICGCRMVYPAGTAEKDLLSEDCKCDFPYCIISCGVSEPEEDYGAAEQLIRLKPYLFCAARISPRKNQLSLCKAANQVGINVILAGGVNSRPYLEQCLACPNVHYFSNLAESELQPVYANAALHVLCSFVETPGLASMEAGICGTDIVSTGEGCAGEYFGNLAHYCNPYIDGDIKRSILSALAGTKQPALKHHMLSKFLWQNCLADLPESYRNLLG